MFAVDSPDIKQKKRLRFAFSPPFIAFKAIYTAENIAGQQRQ
jgi:hypothetical protein